MKAKLYLAVAEPVFIVVVEAALGVWFVAGSSILYLFFGVPQLGRAIANKALAASFQYVPGTPMIERAG